MIEFIFGCALILAIYWLIYSFDRAFGIKFIGKKKTIYASGISIPTTNMTTNITLISQDGRSGEYFLIPGFSISLLEKVGFYLTFGEGRLSHDYLDTKLNIFKRPELEKFKTVLLESKLAEFKNCQIKKQGLCLTDQGRRVFRELGRKYPPTPLERNQMRDNFKKYGKRS
jgi:hypothetical protein